MKLFKIKHRRDATEAQKGFTLIELSIVLVIVGLLVGGVIKGQELIKNAKQNNLRNAFQGYIAATANYQGNYRALPGDDPAPAAQRWNVPSGDGSGRLNANQEVVRFWGHLAGSGLISGNPTSPTNPTTPFSGVFYVYNGGAGWTNVPVLCASQVPGDVALRLLASEDDGVPSTGDWRATTAAGPTATGIGNPGAVFANPANLNSNNSFSVCTRL